MSKEIEKLKRVQNKKLCVQEFHKLNTRESPIDKATHRTNEMTKCSAAFISHNEKRNDPSKDNPVVKPLVKTTIQAEITLWPNNCSHQNEKIAYFSRLCTVL